MHCYVGTCNIVAWVIAKEIHLSLWKIFNKTSYSFSFFINLFSKKSFNTFPSTCFHILHVGHYGINECKDTGFILKKKFKWNKNKENYHYSIFNMIFWSNNRHYPSDALNTILFLINFPNTSFLLPKLRKCSSETSFLKSYNLKNSILTK